MDGEPLENAEITFQPEQGRPSSGITDHEGKYHLQYTITRPGAMVGRHRVMITTAIEQTDDTRLPERVPSKYNIESDVVRDVKPGSNVYDFELES